MFNNKLYSLVLLTFGLTFSVSSCSDEETLDLTNTSENQLASASSNLQVSSNSPFSFDNDFNGDDFQVDNDGNGAHNWDTDEYEDDPVDNGFDVRDYIWVSNGLLHLQCPNDNDGEKRRAEYRSQLNIDLSDGHSMDFNFDVRDYDNESELILAQLHNDNSDARRPYITIVAEDGEVRLQRTNAPTGSSTTTASETIPYRVNDEYRIRIDSDPGTRSTFVRIINEDTNERARTTFNFASAWDDLDGDFYWKFGAYMPDGGSDDTRMRMSRIAINQQ